ncbi:claudin-14-like [Styela clava]
MAGALHYLGCIIAVFAVFGTMVTLIHHEWKHTSDINSPGHLQSIHMDEGLWIRCTYPAPGLVQCDTFGKSMFTLPGELHAQRAMMILSQICAFTGLVICLFSLPCTTVDPKLRLGRLAGCLLVVAGILCLIPVSMYAADVVRDFRSPIEKDFKYTFGPTLYIGWLSAALSILSGIIIGFCARDLVDFESDAYMEKTAYI